MNKNKIHRKKTPFWFYIIAILIPILFLILLESGLRVFDYGKDYSTFVKISDQFEDYLFPNPKLPQKYFSDDVKIPSVIPDAFLKDKPKNGFRIFVLGGSSTAGFPFPSNASFPQFMRRKLELLYPQIQFEVINMGVSAVNSIFIQDIYEDVLEQNPDLILFYAGHNEYYGALGAASNNSPLWLTRLNLQLKNLKTYQLLEDFIASVYSVFSLEEEAEESKTLMAAMAGEQLIEPDSEQYKKGIHQFEENLDNILEESKEKNVSVILGKLVSNLRQKPLESILNPESEAVKIFNQAEKEFEEENFVIAKKLFEEAKEKDALRFRAPEEINLVIDSLGKKYNYSVIDINSNFENSEKFTPASSLFTDHLHPNIEGYEIIANAFLTEMMNGILSKKENKFNIHQIDKILKDDFPFTALDSAYSKFTIELLLNTYPFKNNNPVNVLRRISLEDKTDSLAMDIIHNKISWGNAHQKLADYYWKKGETKNYYKEMNVLIENKPFYQSPYIAAAEKLLTSGRPDLGERIIGKLHKRLPGEYSETQLGLLNLKRKNFSAAIFFLEEAVKYNPNNPDIFFNLSNAYFFAGKIDKALEFIKRTLELNPRYPNAQKILNALKRAEKDKARKGK